MIDILRKSVETAVHNCNWIPSDEDKENEKNERFCFAAEDDLGNRSERRCVLVIPTNKSDPAPTNAPPATTEAPTVAPACVLENYVEQHDANREAFSNLIKDKVGSLLELENLKVTKHKTINNKINKFVRDCNKIWDMMIKFEPKKCVVAGNSNKTPSELNGLIVNHDQCLDMSTYEKSIKSQNLYFSWRLWECRKNGIVKKLQKLEMQIDIFLNFVPQMTKWFTS